VGRFAGADEPGAMELDEDDVGSEGENVDDDDPDVFRLTEMVGEYLRIKPAESIINISTVRCDGMKAMVVNVASKFTLVRRLPATGRFVRFRPNLPVVAESARMALAFDRAPKTMPSVRTSIEYPPVFGRTSAALYESGEVVFVGSASADQARLAAQAYAYLALGQRLGLDLVVRDFTVTNIVVRHIFDEAIDLSLIKQYCGSRCKWRDPLKRRRKRKRKHAKRNKYYSAARVRSLLPGKKKMLFFSTGAMLIIGAKYIEEVLVVMREARDIITQSVIQSTAVSTFVKSEELTDEQKWQADIQRANRSVRLTVGGAPPAPVLERLRLCQ